MSKGRLVRGILLSLGLAISLVAFLSYEVLYVKRGTIFDQYETGRGTLTLKVTSFHETAWLLFVPGAIYDFEANPAGESWEHVMTVRIDDPNPIPRSQIRFLDERTAYLFMAWKYAVTRDGGITWSVWNAREDASLKCRSYISDVQLESNGVGTMQLELYQQHTNCTLRTTDYGLHWIAK